MDALVRDLVWSFDARGAGIVIVKFPGGEDSVFRCSALISITPAGRK